jgi:hypothetical protein
MVATLGERHLLCRAAFDLAELPEPWGEASMENLGVFQVERNGDVDAVWLFPVSHVGRAVVCLFEQFAEGEADPGPEQDRAVAAATAVAAWSDANPDVIVDDVLELDLEHVVLVGHDGEQAREVVLRFDAWERFTRPFPARAFADAVRERDLDPATTVLTVVATRAGRVALAEVTTGELVVQEIDSRGAHVRWAWFASDDVDGAYATLDDWFTEVHGSRAGRPLVDLDLYDHPDRAAFDAYNAPDLVVEDHRLAGHATCSSRDEFFALIAGMRRDLVDLRLRQRHVLACARGLLAVVDQMGSVAVDASADLTPFEGSIVAVEELDDGGRVVRVDLYGEDQLADAVARYDAVAAGDARSKRPPGWERFEPVHPRTTEELAESLAPDVRIEDHRTLVGLPADGIDDVLERFDQMQRDTSIEVSTELLASRGQRFELAEIQRRGTWGLSGDVEQSHLSLGERNDDGRMVRIAFFDVEDRARAFAALDEWYLAGRELTWPSMLTVPAYDVTALETRLAPDVALEDHRLVGVETVHGRAPVLELLDGLRRQLSSVTTSVLHALEHERAGLYLASESGAVTATWAGDLAPFEYLIVSLTEYDETGLVVRWHLYDETQLREALARYDDLAPVAAQPTGGPGWERFERMRPPDIDELAARLAPDVRIEDHRSLVGVPADGRDDVLDQLSKLQRDTSLRIWGELLATRGGRFALNEVHHRGTWGPSGEIEQSHLGLVEHDDDGRIVRMAFFEVEDREWASATLDEWYLAGRELGWPSMLSTVQAYDSGRLEELNLAPDVVWEDHRLLGLGTRRGRDQVIDLIDGMRRAASSMAISTLHALEHERAGLYVASESGSVAATGPGDVAPFEYLVVSLTEHDDRGLVVAWHIYDEAQLPEALTRYDALAPQV